MKVAAAIAEILKREGVEFLIGYPVNPIIEANLATFIDPENFRLTEEISLFPTPGHTPGHCSVLIESRGKKAVITGDMMHHPIQLTDPTRHGRYESADHGYDKRYGSKDEYRDTYREGFRAGYAEGYRGVMMTRSES